MNLLKGQRGLSLVELMVALLLSSFLILGVTQIYIDNKRSYLFQQGQSENQENGRFALLFLEKELARAGYRRDPRGDIGDAFPANNQLSCGFLAGQSIVRVDASTLCTRYQPRDVNETDCEGNLPFSSHTGLDEPYAETFSSDENIIQKITLNNGSLTCQSASSKSAIELIEGLQAIYFDYGVNSDLDERQITKYTAAPASSEFVRSLRYSLLLAATPSNLSQGVTSRLCENDENTDSIGDWQKLTGQTFDCTDGKLYQMVSGSSTLRNLMP
ncbi:prepilin-type N-terminal cleavage/methylation domain-containing protein [Phytopseudomonas dryadis]|uniref:Pilus assembly protein PilW n=1 Tax=Phytopseudomonas dryadis TaxID=2487520 RepID=A0ABY1Z5V0_9GAMM|nr:MULTISPECIES: prepilin-type N-terminal cleavage/methylation domain-containing protein [Pseudomonas]TBV04698.1 pilus assembly protein PilW [Pseudomonas dryadis]TBV17215.1 pilus assembly protein PilW [Pseudomonas sp. FRB 230]